MLESIRKGKGKGYRSSSCGLCCARSPGANFSLSGSVSHPCSDYFWFWCPCSHCLVFPGVLCFPCEFMAMTVWIISSELPLLYHLSLIINDGDHLAIVIVEQTYFQVWLRLSVCLSETIKMQYDFNRYKIFKITLRKNLKNFMVSLNA